PDGCDEHDDDPRRSPLLLLGHFDHSRHRLYARLRHHHRDVFFGVHLGACDCAHRSALLPKARGPERRSARNRLSTSEAYRLRSVDPIRASALARRIGASTTLGQILLHRGIEAPEAAFEFLNPRLRDLCDPSSMLDLERAVERIAAAIRRKERIVVFGDYDVDG